MRHSLATISVIICLALQGCFVVAPSGPKHQKPRLYLSDDTNRLLRRNENFTVSHIQADRKLTKNDYAAGINELLSIKNSKSPNTNPQDAKKFATKSSSNDSYDTDVRELFLGEKPKSEPKKQKKKVPVKPEKRNRKKVSQIIDEANMQARKKPVEESYHNAVVKYAFEPNVLYSIYTAVGKVTDIRFQKSEAIISVNAGDTANWMVEHNVAGGRHHLFIKPTHPYLKTNLTVLTDKRTYFLFLKSWKNTFMAGCEWIYPQESLDNIRRIKEQRIGRFNMENLNFDYTVETDCSDCIQPMSVFSDEKNGKLYLIMPERIKNTSLPALFAIDEEGKAEMINYRFDSKKFAIDGLYPRLMLQYGGKNRQVYIYKAGSEHKDDFGSFLNGLFSGNSSGSRAEPNQKPSGR